MTELPPLIRFTSLTPFSSAESWLGFFLTSSQEDGRWIGRSGYSERPYNR